MIDRTGLTYGKLRVIRHQGTHTYPSGQTTSRWLCQCTCGDLVVRNNNVLGKGSNKSCPECTTVSRRTPNLKTRTHGKSKTSTYRSWMEMKTRCYKADSPNYYKYGERGIKVCDRWLESFENFYEDMGDKPSKDHSLDRIDNDGDYCPENCRWATSKEQAKNRRSSILIDIDGEVRCLSDWCNEFGLSYKSVNGKLYNSPHLHSPSTVFSGFYRDYANYVQQGKTL